MMCDTAKKSLKPQGSVECWQTRGKISVDEGRKITGHAAGMLTEMEDWNQRMKEFFGRTLQLKP